MPPKPESSLRKTESIKKNSTGQILKMADAVLEGKELRANNAKTNGKIQKVEASDANAQEEKVEA